MGEEKGEERGWWEDEGREGEREKEKREKEYKCGQDKRQI